MAAGDAAVEAGEYDRASDIFYEVYDATEDITALYKLAEATTLSAEQVTGDIAIKRYELAAGYARDAIELEPDRAEGYMELARALGRLAQYKGIFESLSLAGEVKENLEKALELDPNNTGAMHALALWHLEVPWIAGGRSENTIPFFEQAISLKPESSRHRTDFGEALLRLDRKEEAKAMLESSIALEVTSYADKQAQAKAQQLLTENF